MPARIVITRPKSSGRVPSIAVEAPSWLSRCPKLSTSASRGRLRSVSGSSVSSAHGISVSAAFFAPEIGDSAGKAIAAADEDPVHGRASSCSWRGRKRRLSRSTAEGYAFSSVHCSGCWFWRAKSITWLTLVSATS